MKTFERSGGGGRRFLAGMALMLGLSAIVTCESAQAKTARITVRSEDILVAPGNDPQAFSMQFTAGNVALSYATTVPADPSGASLVIGNAGSGTLIMEEGVEYQFERVVEYPGYYNVPITLDIGCDDLEVYAYEGDSDVWRLITAAEPALPFMRGRIVYHQTLRVDIATSCECGPEMDMPRLTADGVATAFAWVTGVVDASWGFEGESLGCRIIGYVRNGNDEVVGVTIQAGTEAGQVTIKATNGDCTYRGDMALTCGTSGGGCNSGSCDTYGGGQLGIGANGPAVVLSLGADGDRSLAGWIYLKPLDGKPLQSPGALAALQTGPATRWVYAENGRIRQAKAGAGLADIVVTDVTGSGTVVGYEVRFYNPDAVSTQVFGIYQINQGYSADPVWRIENPDSSGATTNRLRVVEMRGTITRTNEFEYVTTNAAWRLENPLPNRDVVAFTTVGTNGTEEVVETLNGSQIVQRAMRRYEPVESGSSTMVLTRVESGASNELQATTFSYYPSSAAVGSKERLKQVLTPEGGWTIYEYDGSGRVSREYSAFQDAAPTTNPAACRMTEYSYVLSSGADGVEDDGSWRPDVPRKVVTYVTNQVVSLMYRTVQERVQVEKQYPGPNPTGKWTDSANLTTTITYYVDEDGGAYYGQVMSVAHPDGTRTAYLYSTDAPSGTETTVVLAGTPDSANLTNILSGTITTSMVGEAGETQERTVQDKENGRNPQLITQEHETYNYTGDPLKRSHTVSFLDGTKRRVQYACCGIDSVVERDGRLVSHVYDAAGRLLGTETTSNDPNVTYQTLSVTNLLDVAGRTLASYRNGTVLVRKAYDSAGRVLVETNALGGVTMYAETVVSNKLVRTTTYADQGERIEHYYRDGQLEKVVGDATHPVSYRHGADSAGEFTVETRLDGNYQPTEEVITRYADGLGRQYKTVYPPIGGTNPVEVMYFNAKGQVWKQVDPDNVTTLFKYNDLGHREYTVVAMDNSTRALSSYAALESSLASIKASTNRVTQTVSGWSSGTTNQYGWDVRCAETRVYPTNNSAGIVVVSKVALSANGLRSWQETRRDQSVVATETSLSGYSTDQAGYTRSRTVTRTQADQTQIVSVYSADRLVSVTEYDADAPVRAMVRQTTYGYNGAGQRTTITDARNGTTSYSFNAADQVEVTTTPGPGAGLAQVTRAYYDGMGRGVGYQYPDGTTSTNEYLANGLLEQASGSRIYPVSYTYDAQGRMKTMTTWQDFSGDSGAATTGWNYNSQRGWLASKDYPDASSGALPTAGTGGPTYTYTAAGRLLTRVWKRGVTATYGYNVAGNLNTVTYSGGVSTPSTTYTNGVR